MCEPRILDIIPGPVEACEPTVPPQAGFARAAAAETAKPAEARRWFGRS